MPDRGYTWHGPDLTQGSYLTAAQTPMKGDALTLGGKAENEEDSLFKLLMALTLFGNPLGPQDWKLGKTPTPSPTGVPPTRTPKTSGLKNTVEKNYEDIVGN